MGLRSKAKQDFPVGAIWFFYGSTPPAGWLECNGQSTTGYGALAAQVGANVPDFRGRSPIGVGTGAGLSARTLGSLYGAEGVVLAPGNMPSHNHGGGAHGHTMRPHTHTAHSHDHGGNGHTHGVSHSHGAHAHSGTPMVGNGNAWMQNGIPHTHNYVAGEASSYSEAGYFTGEYADFSDAYSGGSLWATGNTNSHSNEAPATGGAVTELGTSNVGTVTPEGGNGSVALGGPARGILFMIRAV